jgi:hypothetical protein
MCRLYCIDIFILIHGLDDYKFDQFVESDAPRVNIVGRSNFKRYVIC